MLSFFSPINPQEIMVLETNIIYGVGPQTLERQDHGQDVHPPLPPDQCHQDSQDIPDDIYENGIIDAVLKANQIVDPQTLERQDHPPPLHPRANHIPNSPTLERQDPAPPLHPRANHIPNSPTLERQDPPPPLHPRDNFTPNSNSRVQPHFIAGANREQQNQEVAPGQAILMSGPYTHVDTNKSRRQHHLPHCVTNQDLSTEDSQV